MAEVDFERRLERMFAEAPVTADETAFAARVEGRLNRGWAARRAMIWIAGVAGGAIGATQLLVSNLRPSLERLEIATPRELITLREAAGAAEWMTPLVGGETLWLMAALAAAAVGLALTRMIEEF
ncbi:MAG: hypothetical protein IT546_01885 [Caulobacteraceae bacterium]|nr:hypothetical protein [Caulobacteraceae bacterium]